MVRRRCGDTACSSLFARYRGFHSSFGAGGRPCGARSGGGGEVGEGGQDPEGVPAGRGDGGGITAEPFRRPATRPDSPRLPRAHHPPPRILLRGGRWTRISAPSITPDQRAGNPAIAAHIWSAPRPDEDASTSALSLRQSPPAAGPTTGLECGVDARMMWIPQVGHIEIVGPARDRSFLRHLQRLLYHRMSQGSFDIRARPRAFQPCSNLGSIRQDVFPEVHQHAKSDKSSQTATRFGDVR